MTLKNPDFPDGGLGGKLIHVCHCCGDDFTPREAEVYCSDECKILDLG